MATDPEENPPVDREILKAAQDVLRDSILEAAKSPLERWRKTTASPFAQRLIEDAATREQWEALGQSPHMMLAKALLEEAKRRDSLLKSPLERLCRSEAPSSALRLSHTLAQLRNPDRKKLESERTELRSKLDQQVAEIEKLTERTKELEGELAKKEQSQASSERVGSELKTEIEKTREALDEVLRTNEELRKKDQLAHLSGRVCDSAWQRLLTSERFQALFEDGRELEAFVVSIDIRRSTELMLRAKSPAHYASFLQGVFDELVGAVHANYGVIDKFTGDGLLAYFTKEFSGRDAAFRVLSTVQSCHAIFQRHYRDKRDAFSVSYKDVGLGIGVDFGKISLLRVTDEPTVIGVPVVYACRLAGAPAGDSYFNHSALTELLQRCPKAFRAEEIEFTIKHEGSVLCYRVALTDSSFQPESPEWLVEQELTETLPRPAAPASKEAAPPSQ